MNKILSKHIFKPEEVGEGGVVVPTSNGNSPKKITNSKSKYVEDLEDDEDDYDDESEEE